MRSISLPDGLLCARIRQELARTEIPRARQFAPPSCEGDDSYIPWAKLLKKVFNIDAHPIEGVPSGKADWGYHR